MLLTADEEMLEVLVFDLLQSISVFIVFDSSTYLKLTNCIKLSKKHYDLSSISWLMSNVPFNG